MASLQTISKLDTFSFSFFISIAWIDISSMAFINSATSSRDVPTIDVDSIVVGKVVTSGTVGASDVARVERTTMDDVGMTVLEVVAKSLHFN